MKLFKTNSINIIEECRVIFGATLHSLLINHKTSKFITKLETKVHCFLSTDVSLVKKFYVQHIAHHSL